MVKHSGIVEKYQQVPLQVSIQRSRYKGKELVVSPVLYSAQNSDRGLRAIKSKP